jgi:hypothetical protein
MFKNLFFILYVSIVFLACNSPSAEDKKLVWNDCLSVEENIAERALALENDTTFLFLDEVMKNRTVLFLGEAGHSDTTTTQLKVNMINHLNRKGFHSVLFEAAPFISSYVFSSPQYNDSTNDWDIRDFFGLWLEIQPFQSLFEQIKNRQIKAFGIDSHVGFYDIKAVKAILDPYTRDEPFNLDWEKLNESYLHRLVFWEKMSEHEQFEMMQMIDLISIYTQYLINKNGKTIDLEVLVQWIKTINTTFSYILYTEPFDSTMSKSVVRKTLLPFRNRDSQMAENILWITEHFPDEKFTVWAANFHGAKKISQTALPVDSLAYFIYRCTGEIVYDKLGDQFYSLAFTSLNNEPDNPSGLLEEAIAKQTNDAPYAFVDFVPLRFADGFRDKNFDAAMIKKKNGKWLYIFDGIYYIRDQI